MSLVNPLLAWGSAADINAFSDFNTPVVTSSIADPFGGTSAYQLQDDNAAAVEGKYVGVTLTVNGTVYVSLFAKAGTATGFGVGWWDNTASVYRGYVDYTWSGGTFTSVTAGYTTYTPIALNSSWYLFRFSFASCIAANTNRLYLFATKTTTSLQGTNSFYLRNVAVVPVIDNVLRNREKRDDSEQVVGSSGVADAWDGGDWYQQECDIRHIPDFDTSSPGNCTGFDGLNEAIGVNCGFDTMLKAGQNKTSLLWVPDSADCSTYVTSEMVDPMQGGVSLEDTNPAYRRIHMKLRNTTTVYAGWV